MRQLMDLAGIRVADYEEPQAARDIDREHA
jgi:hypothetical protein